MITFKELQELAALRIAKDLLWDSLSAKEQGKYLKIAAEKRDLESAENAVRCCVEATKAMSKPGYVSRADSAVYLPKSKKKK